MSKYKKINIKEIKQKIFEIHKEKTEIVKETFTKLSKKCQFIDIKYGEFEACPRDILNGKCHPLNEIQKIKQQIIDIHNDQIKIIEKTYKGLTVKCQFEDIEYGIWSAKPYFIINGQNHPLRARKNAAVKLAQIYNNKSQEEKDLIQEKTKQTFILNHGEDNIFKTQKFKDNLKEKNLQNWGTENVFASPKMQEQLKHIHLEKRGVDNPRKCKKVQEKTKQTMMKNHGVESPQQSKEIQERTRKTCVKRFKTEYASQNKEIRKQIEKTCLEKFGYKCSLNNPTIKQKTLKTLLKNHGVTCFFQTSKNREKCNSKEACLKRHQTNKERGNYKNQSNIENQFYEFLLTIFEPNDVERQCYINNWSIDFYIKSKQLFVQFDGEYYHGLDRPLEEIKLLKCPTDKNILGTYTIDQIQNQWFQENSFKLFRITDKKFGYNPKKRNLDEIKLQINSF